MLAPAPELPPCPVVDPVCEMPSAMLRVRRCESCKGHEGDACERAGTHPESGAYTKWETIRPCEVFREDSNVTVSRRRFLRSIGALAGAGGTWAGGVYARGDRPPNRVSQPSWRHGLSQFGDLKYPPGFPQFDYVDANAPKGGSVRESIIGTFDNFNMVPAGVKGNIAAGIELIHDTLLLPSLDESSSEYGLLAEALSYPPDFSSVSYRLHPHARWHDGMPITAEDVVFSFYAFKHSNPQLSS